MSCKLFVNKLLYANPASAFRSLIAHQTVLSGGTDRFVDGMLFRFHPGRSVVICAG
jgi:hypothetical protein